MAHVSTTTGRYAMNAPASLTITPVRVADLLAEGERMPVYVHVIDHRPTDVNPPDLTYDVDRSQQLDERAIL